jgi:hypothetical protein
VSSHAAVLDRARGGRRAQHLHPEGRALITARIKASIAGFDGDFVEAHALDARTARKIPKKMIGRSPPLREANSLLDRL